MFEARYDHEPLIRYGALMTNIPDDVPCREARKAMRELYESAHKAFMDRLEIFVDRIEFPLSYDLAEEIQGISWGPIFSGFGIGSELKEAINQLHAWYSCLVDWSLWIDVLKQFEGEQEWFVRKQYVEHLAFYCMLQPSATRERFGSIATTALHQANLILCKHYKDHLDQDRYGFLSRKRREDQLKRLGAEYANFPLFRSALARLDDKAFSQDSYNFRHLASHGIAPRFEQGETSFFTRSICPLSELVHQSDGSALLVDHPTKKSVCYGFGGRGPLSFQQAYDACWDEYLKAVKLFHAYQTLLRELQAALTDAP